MSAALQAFLRLAREHRQYRRELMQEIAAAVEKTASQKPLGLPDRVRPLLKKAEGVLEDAIAYGKRRLAAGKPAVSPVEEEDERFYEEHGFYPARDEEWDEDWGEDGEEEEAGSSDKDEQDGQDDLTGKQEKTDEEKGEEPEQEKSFDTDDADGEDSAKQDGLIKHALSGNDEQKTQEAQEQDGIIPVPP